MRMNKIFPFFIPSCTVHIKLMPKISWIKIHKRWKSHRWATWLGRGKSSSEKTLIMCFCLFVLWSVKPDRFLKHGCTHDDFWVGRITNSVLLKRGPVSEKDRKRNVPGKILTLCTDWRYIGTAYWFRFSSAHICPIKSNKRNTCSRWATNSRTRTLTRVTSFGEELLDLSLCKPNVNLALNHKIRTSA